MMLCKNSHKKTTIMIIKAQRQKLGHTPLSHSQSSHSSEGSHFLNSHRRAKVDRHTSNHRSRMIAKSSNQCRHQCSQRQEESNSFILSTHCLLNSQLQRGVIPYETPKNHRAVKKTPTRILLCRLTCAKTGGMALAQRKLRVSSRRMRT